MFKLPFHCIFNHLMEFVFLLQLWAVERLSLCGPHRDFVFPRILSWPDVTFKTRRIEMHFVDTQVMKLNCCFNLML